jgi:hypothetical protein
MDNDHEIVPENGRVPNKVQLFLQESLRAIRHDDQKRYDLDIEFAKTRKNKNYFVVSIIFAVAIIIVAASWFVTSRIDQSSRNVPVDISVFDDINLRNVLDLAKRAEDTLSMKRQERDTLQANFQAEISNIAMQKKSALDIIAEQKLSKVEGERRWKAIVAQFAAQERTVNTAYKKKFAVIDAAITDAEKQVASFDTKRVEDARAQKKILDSQRDLYDLEKKQMQDTYESQIAGLRRQMAVFQDENAKLKTDQVKELINEYQSRISALDPAFQDTQAAQYLQDVGKFVDPGAPALGVPANIPAGIPFSADDFDLIKTGYAGIEYLLSKVAGIPFENDPGNYIQAARKIVNLTGNAGVKLIDSSFAIIDATNRKIAEDRQKLKETEAKLDESQKALADAKKDFDAKAQAFSAYEKALVDSAIANAYAGYIIDVQNQDDPTFLFVPDQIDLIFKAEKPEVYVYRGARTLVATLKLSKDETGVHASAIKREGNRTLQSMDYIVLKKRSFF